MKTIWEQSPTARGTGRAREGAMDGGRKGRASEEVWKTWSECFQGKTSLTRGGLADAVAVQCSDSSVFMFYCKSWLSEWETFRWLWCGYVTVYAVFVFLVFFFVPVSTPWGCGIRGCVCVHPVSRGLTVNWMEKQIRSGVRFHVRPAAAAISSPRRHLKSKTDKKPRFIPVRKKKKNPDLLLCRRRRGKPCKLHGTHFFFFPPSLKNVWKVYKQAGLEKSLELLISSHLPRWFAHPRCFEPLGYIRKSNIWMEFCIFKWRDSRGGGRKVKRSEVIWRRLKSSEELIHRLCLLLLIICFNVPQRSVFLSSSFTALAVWTQHEAFQRRPIWFLSLFWELTVIPAWLFVFRMLHHIELLYWLQSPISYKF